MKLRIKGDSLRLRLTQSEVKEVAEGKVIKEEVHFGLHDFLAYSIRISQEKITKVEFVDSHIHVFLPQEEGLTWTNSDMISIKAEQEINSERSLKILIEKDFKCLTVREDEDESDNFPHPTEHQLNC